MNRKYRYFLTLVFVLIIGNFFSWSQETKTEALLSELNRSKNDSVKCQILKVLFSTETDPKLRLEYNKSRESIALQNIKTAGNKNLKNYYIKNLAGVYNNYGVLYGLLGDHDRSIENYYKSVQIKEGELLDTLSAQQSLMSIAFIYKSIGKMEKALEIMNNSLRTCQHYRDASCEANALNHIAIVYSIVGDYSKALECENIALSKLMNTNDYRAKAEILNNIGVFYYDQNRTDSASIYWKKVLAIYEELNDQAGLANILSNIGITYNHKGDFKNAEEYFLKSESIYKTLPDKRNYPLLLIDLSELYLFKKDYAKAIAKAKQAEQLLEQLGTIYEISHVYYLLYSLHKERNEYKQSFIYFERYNDLNDSLKSNENRKSAIRSQLKYEYEKQAAADSVAHAKDSEVKNVELERQKTEINARKNQQYALFGGLGLVCLFGVFMFNRYKITQKQKEIIEEQKEVVENQKILVEVKQKELLDSIRYAKRIQLAQIPSEKRIHSLILKSKK